MPYGGNDWLALTREPTLEPDLPICDLHPTERAATFHDTAARVYWIDV